MPLKGSSGVGSEILEVGSVQSAQKCVTPVSFQTKNNICLRIPGFTGPLLRAAHLLYGGVMVFGETSLSMLGVKGYACIQLVFDFRFPK